MSFAVASLSILLGSGQTVGTGPVVKATRPIPNVTRLAVNSAVTVDLKLGGSPSLIVEGQANVGRKITTKISGETLIIGIDGDINTSKPLRVLLTLPKLDSIQISGASQLSVASMKASALEVWASGAARIRAQGSANRLRIALSGASKADLSKLKTEMLDLEASGASTALLNVSKSLKARVSGASSVHYLKKPASMKIDADFPSVVGAA